MVEEIGEARVAKPTALKTPALPEHALLALPEADHAREPDESAHRPERQHYLAYPNPPWGPFADGDDNLENQAGHGRVAQPFEIVGAPGVEPACLIVC